MYYVNHNACPTLEDAQEVTELYKAAGIAVDILTEAEYFERLHWSSVPEYQPDQYWQDPV